MAALRNGGTAIWVMAHPLLLRWDGMRWEPKRAVNTGLVNILRSKNLPVFSGESVNYFSFISASWALYISTISFTVVAS